MAKKKNTPLPIDPELTEGVIQAALARPKRGARRLASDLKSDGRTVSESIVRTILRQNGLHRSELRLKVLEERFLAGALDPTDEQLDALISFNPRLRERNSGLREPSLLVQDVVKLETHGGSGDVMLHAAADPGSGPALSDLSPASDAAPVEPPRPPSAPQTAPSSPVHRRRHVRAEWVPSVERWVLHAVNAMLGLLVLYLGWTVGSEILDLRESAVRDVAEPAAASAREPVTAQTAAPPLQQYRVVWKRNLFGVAPAAVATQDKVDLENIALAGRDIGLKLIGTAVGKDPARNYAIIETLSTREQVMYQEQERVGKVLIRAILRNNVVVENADGSRRRLSVDEEPGKGGRTAAQAAAPAIQEPQAAEMPGVFQVRLTEVPASPEDIRKTVEELKLSPQTEDGTLSGFSVGRLRAKDVLWQAGLRTGDVIKGVDEEEFNSPQDLEYFFQRLARGGEVSIMAERRGRPVQLNVKIE